MSAWMVNKLHIDLLVQVAVEGPHVPITPATAWHPFRYLMVPNWILRDITLGQRQEVSRTVDLDGAEALGQMLAAQNAASLRAGYENADGRGMIPFWADESYEHTPIPPTVPPAGPKAPLGDDRTTMGTDPPGRGGGADMGSAAAPGTSQEPARNAQDPVDNGARTSGDSLTESASTTVMNPLPTA